MTHALRTGKEPSLKKIVLVSAVLHLIFIALIIIPIKTKDQEFRSYQVKLVGSVKSPAKGRTTTGQRRKRTIPKKKITKKTPPKTDMKLEKIDKVAKEIKRIRAISALSKKKKKQQQKAKAIDVLRKEVMDDASGGSVTPGNGIASDSDPYYALIHDRIWGRWVWHDPDSMDLTAVISIKIGKDGKVVSREIDQSSGNALFDRSAMNAIIKASPLPPPPVEMEVVLRFRP